MTQTGEIKVAQQINALFSESDIKQLIIDHMAKQNLPAPIEPKDIKVHIDGGYLDDSYKQWGGPSIGGPELVPAKFVGFRVNKAF